MKEGLQFMIRMAVELMEAIIAFAEAVALAEVRDKQAACCRLEVGLGFMWNVSKIDFLKWWFARARDIFCKVAWLTGVGIRIGTFTFHINIA